MCSDGEAEWGYGVIRGGESDGVGLGTGSGHRSGPRSRGGPKMHLFEFDGVLAGHISPIEKFDYVSGTCTFNYL